MEPDDDFSTFHDINGDDMAIPKENVENEVFENSVVKYENDIDIDEEPIQIKQEESSLVEAKFDSSSYEPFT